MSCEGQEIGFHVMYSPSQGYRIVAGRTFDELSLPYLSLAKASSTSAQPPLALSEERVRAQGGRQLGYDCMIQIACM